MTDDIHTTRTPYAETDAYKGKTTEDTGRMPSTSQGTPETTRS